MRPNVQLCARKIIERPKELGRINLGQSGLTLKGFWPKLTQTIGFSLIFALIPSFRSFSPLAEHLAIWFPQLLIFIDSTLTFGQ